MGRKFRLSLRQPTARTKGIVKGETRLCHGTYLASQHAGRFIYRAFCIILGGPQGVLGDGTSSTPVNTFKTFPL